MPESITVIMGRHASFEPFRKKINGVEYGNYLCYSPISKSTVDLNTTDSNDAIIAANNLRSGTNENAAPSLPTVDKPVRTEIVRETETINPLDALNNYLSQTNVETEQSSTTGTATSQPTIQSGAPSPGIPGRPDLGRTQLVHLPNARKAKGLTPEQSEKIAQALSKGAAKINLMVDEIAITLIGRKIKDDLEFDDTDIAFLKLGWEMQMEQWFQKSNPEPWHLIVAGNIFVVLALLKNSESRKKDKRNDQQAAT